MEFAHSNILWSLMAVPVLAPLAWWDRRARLRRWRAAGQSGLPPRDGEAVWLLILALIVLALARPRWGQLRWEASEPGRDVVLMLDVSLSMAAEDVVPNRLGGAVEAARSLLDRLGREPGDRVGVVAFAGRGAIRCPLTANLGAVSNVLDALRPGTLQPGGTDLGSGLDEALKLFDEATAPKGGRSIIVLSDGEDHASRWASRLDRLRDQGVVAHTIAIGDRAEGHPIPVPEARSTSGPPPGTALDPDAEGYLTYQGKIVKSRCEDASLRQLALSTAGAFVPIGRTRADLAALYDRAIAPLERSARIAHRHRSPERAERFQFALFLAILGGMVGAWPRRRRRPTTTPGRWRRRLRRIFLLPATALALIPSLGVSERQNIDILNQEGIHAFKQENFETALRNFERVQRRAQSPTATYNVAATLFQLGRFEEARRRYQAARRRARPPLALKIDYALGNTALAQRRLPAALRHYDDCLASTVPGPPYERIRGFAAQNRAFAERLARLGIEELPAEAPTDAPSAPGGRKPSDPAGGGDDPPSESGTEDGGDRGAEGGSNPTGGEDMPAGSERIDLGRVGGGGGSDNSKADSPAEQLDEAIAAIRDARRRFILDTPASTPTRANRKIW